MAEIVLFEAGQTFIIKMSEGDMERLTMLCTHKRTNYFDTVIACFHAGLVAMTEHCNKCLNSGDPENVKENQKKT